MSAQWDLTCIILKRRVIMMIVKFAVASTVAALVASSATAGGFASPIVNSQPGAVATVGGWSGAYVGANINYGKAEVKASGELGDLISEEGLSRTLTEPDGGSAAVRAGYDWQAGNAVFGLGAEYNVGKYKNGLSGDYDDALDFVGATAEVEVKNTATIFARAGYLVSENFLAYGLVGYTHAKAEVSASFESESASGSETLKGATFGVGGEYKFGPRWTGYAEYAYTDFGDLADTDGDLEANLNQVKIGANFRF